MKRFGGGIVAAGLLKSNTLTSARNCRMKSFGKKSNNIINNNNELMMMANNFQRQSFHSSLSHHYANQISDQINDDQMIKKNGKIKMMAEMMLNKKGQLNEMLGVKITKLNMVLKEDRSNIDELFVEMSMKLSDVHMNAIGLVHGGSFATLCDTAIGTGALIFATQYLKGSGMVVLDNFNQFLKSASVGDELVVVAKPLHLGKSTQSWEATVYLGSPPNGKKIALSRSTILNKVTSESAQQSETATSNSNASKKLTPENLNKLGKNFNIETMSKQEIAAKFDKHSEQWEFLTSVSDYQKNMISWVVNELKQYADQQLSSPQFANETFKVLDLATGNGLIGRSINNIISPRVKKLEMTGLDLSQGMLKKAKEWNIYSNLFVHDLDQPINNLSTNESFDFITCFAVSEMLTDVDKVLLSEVSRLLSRKPHAQCWISFQLKDEDAIATDHQGMRTYNLSQLSFHATTK
ncbi:hypothetical protein NAEGRDRAFT_78002 [Naegleria gruberi]|uniref:Uncharacterized protein n=1 Tax=Naegleria gruberi TaxID=5762 RepID=D2V037_NAEGR|nr:uncharacterized protein NAEGRDRAFT_78002 [Naegleria gruberi]EFC49461.1 hypothetical protein NAEGRDRAFT_78002 [Naegleria gruberi]|eukprot:XP_002682205.1 hypothetical protein NAEGRDRAFT_78002 [Naegleria gruberi strain NEG-M]